MLVDHTHVVWMTHHILCQLKMYPGPPWTTDTEAIYLSYEMTLESQGWKGR